MSRLRPPSPTLVSTVERGGRASSEATGTAVVRKRQSRTSSMKKMCGCCSSKGLVKFAQLHENQYLVHSFSHLAIFPPNSLFPRVISVLVLWHTAPDSTWLVPVPWFLSPLSINLVSFSASPATRIYLYFS